MHYKPDIKIAIAEDHELYREGLISRIRKEGNIEVVGDVENGKDMLEFLSTQTVDIVLMDVSMPIMDGIQTTKQIAVDYPEVKVIALTMYDHDSVIIDMLMAGASGYLLKNTGFEEMLDVIYRVYDGNKSYARSIYHRIVDLIGDKKYNPHEAAKHHEYNETELQILKLLAQCYSAREIGEILGVSDRTIEGIKSRLLVKLEAKNTVGAVIMALKRRLITLEDC